jgi:DNA-binding NtrC family response regulator
MFAFVIRDASRVESARPTDSMLSSDNVRSILGMVGTASLKDIVARSSDVVEKMCIEAAVDLTQNNRVAAAEMLGLSRQSLYVKLRKYDLVSKNGGNDE